MSTKQRAVVVGAVVAGLLSTSYLAAINIICCLGVIIGGLVAAQQFASSRSGAIQTGDAALLGAGAGALGAVFSTVFELVLRPLSLDSQSIIQDYLDSFAQQMRQSGEQLPPGFEQAMQQGEQGIGAILLGVVISMILYAIFGAIGGAIGGSIFGSDGGEPPAGQEPPSSGDGDRGVRATSA
jgi:hypothetical protein